MFILREDQQKIVTQVIARDYDRVVVCASTGWGKSVAQSEIARYYMSQGKTVLVLVHRDNLVRQLADSFRFHGLNNLGFIKAGFKPNFGAKVQLASIQTLARRKLHFIPDVILIDECHVCTHSKVVTNMLSEFTNTYFIGFTATPMPSTPRRGLKKYYQSQIIAPVPFELMEDGRLARDVYFVEKHTFTDDAIKSLGVNSLGEYNTRDLNRLTEDPNLLNTMVDYWETYGDNRLTVGFTAGVEFSKTLAQRFNDRGHTAVSVDGTMKVEERNQIYKDFGARKIKLLMNCMVLVEGFDVKAVECVLLAKPIRSTASYIQMVGRGLRALEGKKDCYILDLGGNTKRHGMIQSLTYDHYKIDHQDKEKGEAILKECPNNPDQSLPAPGYSFPEGSENAPDVGCGASIHASASHCPHCGYVFPVKNITVVKGDVLERVENEQSIEDLREANRLAKEKVHGTEEGKKAFYLEKRFWAFKKKRKPTMPFAAFMAEYDEYPKKSWNKGQLTLGKNEKELKKFFTWIADWAVSTKKGDEIYKAFNHQVGLEFGINDCKELPEAIKPLARECYKAALQPTS